LFWANDPEDPIGRKVRADFSAAVKAIRVDAEVAFIFTDDSERLCYAHLGVLAQIAPVPLGGVVTLDVWAPSEFDKVTSVGTDDHYNETGGGVAAVVPGVSRAVLHDRVTRSQGQLRAAVELQHDLGLSTYS
jgi:hypothetical protein